MKFIFGSKVALAFLLLLLSLQKRKNDAALIVRRNESAHASLAPASAIVEGKRRQEAATAWSAVVRQRGANGDVIELAGGSDLTPTDAECQRLFGIGARRLNDSTMPSCACKTSAPLFRHDTGECVMQIRKCLNPISFRNTTIRHPPLLSIGVSPPVAGNDSPLFEGALVALWKESAVKVRVGGTGARCALASARRFDIVGEWQPIDVNSLLRLGWTTTGGGQATIFWQKGADDIADLTAGTLLSVELSCGTTLSPTLTPTHCMTFRVAGRMANPQDLTGTTPEDNQEDIMRDKLRAASFTNIKDSSVTLVSTVPATTVLSQLQQGRLETMLIILLVVLLFLSIVGSAILWRICWRIKKSKLISNLQMQFLYHIKQENEKAACAAAASVHSRYRVNSATGEASDQMRHNFSSLTYGNRDEEFDATVEPIFGDQLSADGNGTAGAAVVKRKLYFSAEFFDPFFMANPPLMAEQFLYDLRRIIVIAKQRIVQRRHVPQLAVIHEEEAETSITAIKPTERPHLLPYSDREDRRPSPNASPRSAKSADSGRESILGDSSLSSSSGGEDVDGATSEPPLMATRSIKPSLPPPLTARLSSLKPQHFLPYGGMTMTTTYRQNSYFRPSTDTQSDATAPSSRIPVSKSPRLQTRPFLTTTTTIDDGEREPDSYYHKVATASPAPTLPPPPPPPPARQPRSRPATGRRNAYAVFPSDSMLKKSLPRRSKKSSNGTAPIAASPPTKRKLVETRI